PADQTPGPATMPAAPDDPLATVPPGRPLLDDPAAPPAASDLPDLDAAAGALELERPFAGCRGGVHRATPGRRTRPIGAPPRIAAGRSGALGAGSASGPARTGRTGSASPCG